jgi:hypothetical protein
MGNVKISAFSSQSDLSQIDGLAGYEGTVGNYTNARISGTQLQTYLQNNLSFATASGTTNYVAKFTGPSALGNSLIRDDGTYIGLLGAPKTNSGVYIDFREVQAGDIGLEIDSLGQYGAYVRTWNSSTSTPVNKIGVYGQALDSLDKNIGIKGFANAVNGGGSARYAIGGAFKATNGDFTYSLQLEDGTESAGKFLKCVTADGYANWATLPATVGSFTLTDGGNSTGSSLSINNTGDDYTLSYFSYNGTTNVGFVPTGGTAQKLLSGDGSWQSPDFTAKQFPFSGVDTDPILSVDVANVTTGQIRLVGGTNVTVTRTNDNQITLSSSGGGTVTSVGLTMPTAFAVANSPVTGNGTLAVTTTGGSAGEFLAYDGSWGTPTGTYTLPLAANGTRGGIQLGYAQNAKNYPVQISSEKAYVNVPWTDNNDNTTYSISSTQTGGTNPNPYLTLTSANPSSTDNVQFIGEVVTVTRNDDDTITWSIPAFSGGANIGTVPTAAAAATDTFLKHDGTWATPSGSGTVTSVGLSMPPAFSVTNTPVTSSGTLTVGVTGGISGQFLAYNGQWAVPANTTYTAGQGISISGSNVISVATTGTVEVGDLKVDGKIENGTGVDLDLDSTEDIKLDAAKDVEITATGSTTGIKLDSDKMVTVEAKEAISLDVKNTATGATPINAQPRLGGAMVVHGDTTGGGAYDGSITLNCSADTHGVTIKSPPHSAAATYTLVLPTSAGSNTEVLQTDGSGNLSWATNGGSSGGGFPGTVSAASANTSTAVDTLYIVTTSALTADIVMTLPTAASNSGKIIGVKYGAQNTSNDTVVIKTISSQTIDGTNRTTNGLPLASVHTYYELVSDGSNWWIK